MPNTIFDMFTAPNIVGYIEAQAPTINDPYLGAALFPNRKNAGLDLSWLKQHTGVAVQLKASSFDVKAELRNRVGIAKIDTEMAFFKEAMRIGEKDRQDLLRVNEAYAQPIIARIFDDIGNLVKGVDVAAERMRMQLLATGQISVTRDGADYEYDYQVPVAHKETISAAANKWSATETADPIADIERWRDVIIAGGGSAPNRAVCNNTVWKHLRNNLSIRKAMNPVGYANIKVKPDDVRQYIYDATKVTVEVYDKTYALEVGGSVYKYYPDNKFTLIPDGDLGNTFYGTTPEEADLMGGVSTDAQVSLINTATAVTVTRESDPVNVNTKVSAVLLPSLPSIGSIFIATVA